ncbi:MAG: cobalamin-binding protein [Nitrospirae bacterium]|nr:cobalamin-binding protein [Nitrospirota bacterium]
MVEIPKQVRNDNKDAMLNPALNLFHGLFQHLLELQKRFWALKSLVVSALLLYCFTAVAQPPNRIVSLAPSVTETLYALGLEDRIVGVTTFCDYPKEAKEKPKIGGMSNPSLEAVLSLKPDIVVMTTDGNPKEFAERLHSLKIKTYVMRARRIHEFPDEIRKLGDALGVRERAEALAKEMEGALKGLKKQVQKPKKVIFIIWAEPLIVAGGGTTINDALTLIGYKNIGDASAINYPKYSIEEIIRQDPELIFIGGGHDELKKLSAKLLYRLKSTSAVKNKKVFYVSDMLYRLSPRLIKGIEELSDASLEIEKGIVK